MNMINTLIAVASLSAGVAMAANKTPNCTDAKGKAFHAKDEKACTKKKGTWTAAATAPTAQEAAPTTHEAAPAAAPETAPTTEAPKK